MTDSRFAACVKSVACASALVFAGASPAPKPSPTASPTASPTTLPLAASLAAQSAIILKGTVLRAGASDEPLQAASASTVVVRITKVIAGSDLVGDQAGNTATIVLSKPGSVRAGNTATFFGNPRFTGKTITITGIGEIVERAVSAAPGSTPRPALAPAIAVGAQLLHDAPIRARLDIANLVFRGTVESEAAVQRGSASPRLPPSRDPVWHAATVRVTEGLRGTKAGQRVSIIFPASKDITYYNGASLKTGQDAFILAHRPSTQEELKLAALLQTASPAPPGQQSLEFVSSSYDVLAPGNGQRLSQLLQAELH